MEVPHGRHRLDQGADGEFVVRPGREAPPVYFLDADLQQCRTAFDADGIGSADLFAVEVVAEGEVLALGEGKGLPVLLSRRQREDNRFSGLTSDVGHPQGIELGHRVSDT